MILLGLLENAAKGWAHFSIAEVYIIGTYCQAKFWLHFENVRNGRLELAGTAAV